MKNSGTKKRPRRNGKKQSGIGAQKAAYDPPKRQNNGGPLSLARSALDSRPTRT